MVSDTFLPEIFDWYQSLFAYYPVVLFQHLLFHCREWMVSGEMRHIYSFNSY